jgi:hypothetical protein
MALLSRSACGAFESDEDQILCPFYQAVHEGKTKGSHSQIFPGISYAR